MCPDPCSMKEGTRARETKDLAKGTWNDLEGGVGMHFLWGPRLFLLLQPRTGEGKRKDISLSGCHPA